MKHFISMVTAQGMEIYIDVSRICAFCFDKEKKLTIVFVSIGTVESAFEFPGNYLEPIKKAIDELEG